VAGVQQQREGVGQRVEPGIVVRCPRRTVRAQQFGVEDRLGARPGDQPATPRRANRAAIRLSGGAPVASTCARNVS
jgi:hypothetical protein